jgi:CheY-like chemotaxis protein
MTFRNLLLIDDDEEDQEIFAEALKEASAEASCLSYTGATEALEDLESGKINPDLIFVDLNMPVMNGHQFLTEIKSIENLRHIPVVIFTTSSNKATVLETMRLGASDFITKPGNLSVLVNVLKPFLV